MAKLSLAEMSAKVDEEAHNSNFQNLAHALRYLKENEVAAEAEYQKFKEAATKLRAEIMALGEKDGAELTYDQVKTPYAHSRSIGLTYNAPSNKGW